MRFLAKFSILIIVSVNSIAPVYAFEMTTEELITQPLEELMNIEVVSKQAEDKYDAAGIVSVVTQEDIERYGGNNLFDILNRVTSIYGISSYSWLHGIVSMRGDLFTHVNNHTLILINGRPFRDSVYGGLNETVLRSFPIHQIEQIEVIRGPGSVLYGSNAYSGVINIVTKKEQDNSLTVRGRYGSYNTGEAGTEFAWKQQDISASGAARYHGSTGWLFNAQDELNQPSSFRRNEDEVSISGFGAWQGFTFNTFFARSHENHWGPAATIGNGYPGENKRLFADLGHEKELNPHWSMKNNLTYNRSDNSIYVRYDGLDALSPIYSSDLLFEQTHFFNFLDKKLNFLIGGLVEWQEGYESLFGTSADYSIPPYSYLKSSIYGEISYKFFDNLKFNIGGQWHRADQLLVNAPAVDGKVGRLGLVYQITPALGAKLLYSQAFRMPAALEIEADAPGILVGDRSLQAEQVETSDAQVFYHTNDYEVSLTAFRSRQSGLINRISVPPPIVRKFANAGSAEFEGLELETQSTLYPGLHWQGAYTFQNNRSGEHKNNATYVPNHIAKFGLSYDLTPDWQIGMFDTYFSAAKIMNAYATIPSLPLNPVADSYHNASLNMNYRLDALLGFSHTKHVSFNFYLDNLFNEKFYYPEFNRQRVNTMPASPGRTLYGEFALEF